MHYPRGKVEPPTAQVCAAWGVFEGDGELVYEHRSAAAKKCRANALQIGKKTYAIGEAS